MGNQQLPANLEIKSGDTLYKVTRNDMDRLADLLANLIEKYADKIDLDKLPEPPKLTDE